MQAVTRPHVHFVVNFPAGNTPEFFKSHSVPLRLDVDKVGEGRKYRDIGPVADGGQLGLATLPSFLQLSRV